MDKEEFEKYYPNLMKWYKEGDCCNDIVELRQENEQLKSQLQQKENIIKEVREILNSKRNILTTQLLNGEYCDYEELLYQIDEEIRKILDKVEENK